MFLGVLLVAIGIIVLSVQFGILPGGIASLIWPVLAIFAGVWLLIVKRDGISSAWLGGNTGSTKKGDRK